MGKIFYKASTHWNCMKQRFLGLTHIELTCSAAMEEWGQHNQIFRCSIGTKVSGCIHSLQQRFNIDKTSSMDSNNHRTGMTHTDLTPLPMRPQNGHESSINRMYFGNVELFQCRGKSKQNGFKTYIQTFVNLYIYKISIDIWASWLHFLWLYCAVILEIIIVVKWTITVQSEKGNVFTAGQKFLELLIVQRIPVETWMANESS